MVLAALVMVGTLMGSGLSSPQGVLAATACPPSASTDSQVTMQQECVDKYVKKCKDMGFPNNFCNSLTVSQVNECAPANGNVRLDEDCLKEYHDQYKEGQKNSNAPTTTSGIEPIKEDCKPKNGEKLDKDNCGIIKMVITITNILGGIAGLVIISTLIYGGIQYSMAGADPSKIQAAKHKIIAALTALLLLIFGFALLQWLVPGGIF